MSPALNATQLEALRHLEIWAAREEDALPAGGAEDDAELLYTVGADGELIAHREASAPPGAVAPVHTAKALEEFTLRAELALRERKHAPDRARLRKLEAQDACGEEMLSSIDRMRRRLEADTARCAALMASTDGLLGSLESQMRARRDEEAIAEALNAQLAPLQAATALGPVLDRPSWGDATPHGPGHPLVSALATLDASARSLGLNEHWSDSAHHLSQVNALRLTALRHVAALITRPLEALTSTASARLSTARATAARAAAAAAFVATPIGAAAAEAQTPHPTPQKGEADGGGGAAGAAGVAGAAEGSVSVSVGESASAAAAKAAAVGAAEEEALLYVGYRTLAAQLAPWATELQARCRPQSAPADFAALLVETQAGYWRGRELLLGASIASGLAAIAAEEGGEGGSAPAEVRACCAHVLRVCREEHRLYCAFFIESPQHELAADIDAAEAGASVGSSALLEAQLESLCYGLYDHVRPLLLRQAAISTLCEIVQILRSEVLTAVRSGGAACTALEPLVERLLQDAQERLIFRVQTFVRDEIRPFTPSPAQLEACAAANAAAGPSRWYETVRLALTCLAQLYRCVPRSVFEGLAQEVLSECSASVGRAAAALRSKRGHVEGTLFTIAQLLTLREQIAPFESEFAITHKALDFSTTRQMVRTLVSRRGRVGGVGGVVELLSHGVPSTVSSHVDAKQALDRELKASCEGFILHATNLAVTPLAPILRTAAPGAAPGAAPPTAGGPPPAAASALPSGPALAAAVAACEAAIGGELASAHATMVSHLPEPATQAILFAPIKANILEALGQLQALLGAIDNAAVRPERLERLAANLEALGAPAEAAEAAPVTPAAS